MSEPPKVTEQQITEANQHLDALLGVEARKPGKAASHPAVIRVIEQLEPAGGFDFPVFPASYAGEGKNDPPPVYDLNGIEWGDLEQEWADDNHRKHLRYKVLRARQCTIDSPQSQANRTELAFLVDEELRKLVPQGTARIPGKPEPTSVLQLPHRIGDFRVRLSRQSETVKAAISDFAHGDGLALLKLMPTSLIFGFWDSRGDGYKHARILLSRIDAFNVTPFEKHSVYNAPYSKDEFASEVLEKQSTTKAEEDAIATCGFSNALSKKGSLGGILCEKIERLSLISLTDIASIFCGEAQKTNAARRYLLALAVLAEAYPRSRGSHRLRSGCELLQKAATKHELLGAGRGSAEAQGLLGLCDNRELLIAVAVRAGDELGIPPNLPEFECFAPDLKAEFEKAAKVKPPQEKIEAAKAGKGK